MQRVPALGARSQRNMQEVDAALASGMHDWVGGAVQQSSAAALTDSGSNGMTRDGMASEPIRHAQSIHKAAAPHLASDHL
jgi:hypothetical protein